MKTASHHTEYPVFEKGIYLSLEGMQRYSNMPGFQGIRTEMSGFLFALQI